MAASPTWGAAVLEGILKDVDQKLLLTTVEEADDSAFRLIGKALERQWRIERVTSLPETYEHFGAAIVHAGGSRPTEVAGECSKIRDRSNSVALVVLAAHGDFHDRLVALTAGADEYLVMDELGPHEMVMRIRLAIARRATQAEIPMVSCGIFAVDLLRPVVSVEGCSEELPVHQWQLMKCLVQAMGQPVTADVLCQFANIQASPNHANLQNAMCRLRRRLEGFSNRIATVKGVGYRIIS